MTLREERTLLVNRIRDGSPFAGATTPRPHPDPARSCRSRSGLRTGPTASWRSPSWRGGKAPRLREVTEAGDLGPPSPDPLSPPCGNVPGARPRAAACGPRSPQAGRTLCGKEESGFGFAGRAGILSGRRTGDPRPRISQETIFFLRKTRTLGAWCRTPVSEGMAAFCGCAGGARPAGAGDAPGGRSEGPAPITAAECGGRNIPTWKEDVCPCESTPTRWRSTRIAT